MATWRPGTVGRVPRYRVEDGEQDGLRTIRLRDADAELEAAYAPTAGMVGCSLRHRGEELLAQRHGLAEYAKSGRTMGIPFLYPWANRLSSFEYDVGGHHVRLDPSSPLVRTEEHGLPIHGLLGASPWWTVAERRAGDDGARVAAQLDFGAHEQLLAAFPFPHVVRMEVELRDGALTVRTTVTPTGDEPVPIAFGYHPYLRLPDVPRADWRVRLPVLRRMVLDERLIPTGATEDVAPFEDAIGERAWDDAYDRLERPARFELRGGGRAVALEFVDGYTFAQVFSPAGAELICFEPMTAPANALHLPPGSLEKVAPGAERTATFSICVRDAG
jgi:aldose 1-epimerase